MKNTPLFAAAALAALLLPGCSTVEYGRQGSLSDYETKAMSCQDIDQEMTRVVGFVEQVNTSTRHSWYNIPAVLETHWIGNSREKSLALESANSRMVQLWTLRDSKKCGNGNGAGVGGGKAGGDLQPLSLPVQKPEVEEQHIN
ncbi:MAG: hypothetical protein H6R10_3013 [Rhodocyclaceae bacterium]|nr:hypothetical protein [Rhodocyclaceae bacterium]